MKIRSLLVTAVLVTAVLCSPVVVSATSLTSAQISAIISLLQVFGADSATIANVQTSLNGGTPATTWCHTFNSNMGVGATGNEVNALIQALAKDGDGGEIQVNDGNYKYSEETYAAVIKFQKKYGITPLSGYVGSLTRAKLNSLYGCKMACIGEGGTVTGSVSPAYATVCCAGLVAQYPNNGLIGASGICVKPTQSSITINSVSGPNSLNIGQTGTWTVNATAPSGTSLTYRVSFGENDGYSGVSSVPLATGLINQAGTFTHAYTSAGTYTVTFTIYGGNNCINTTGMLISDCKSAQTSLTVVIGNSAQPSITVISPNGGETLTAGRPFLITWNTTALSSSDDVQIYLYNSSIHCDSVAVGCTNWFTISNSKNTGSYTWDTDTLYGGSTGPYPLYIHNDLYSFPQSSIYKIIIISSSNNNISDSSNNYFSIVRP